MRFMSCPILLDGHFSGHRSVFGGCGILLLIFGGIRQHFGFSFVQEGGMAVVLFGVFERSGRVSRSQPALGHGSLFHRDARPFFEEAGP
jgi:hypothetical protein